jgi:hypothetical protein
MLFVRISHTKAIHQMKYLPALRYLKRFLIIYFAALQRQVGTKTFPTNPDKRSKP